MCVRFSKRCTFIISTLIYIFLLLKNIFSNQIFLMFKLIKNHRMSHGVLFAAVNQAICSSPRITSPIFLKSSRICVQLFTPCRFTFAIFALTMCLHNTRLSVLSTSSSIQTYPRIYRLVWIRLTVKQLPYIRKKDLCQCDS